MTSREKPEVDRDRSGLQRSGDAGETPTALAEGYDLDPTAPATVALQADYQRRSDDASRLPGARLNLAYGEHERQRLDVFSAGAHAPTLVFFHGGYWRAGSKGARRFPAPQWRVRGVSWVTVNYRLLPEHSLADAADDARAAVVWLAARAGELRLDPAQLHVTGNSAGGHLAALVASEVWQGRPQLASLTAISGLFDLAPLAEVYTWLQLGSRSACDLSPIHQLPPCDLPVLIGWGGAETRAFAEQSRAYAEACRGNGNPVETFVSNGADHFQIIGEYAEPASTLFDHLTTLLGTRRAQ